VDAHRISSLLQALHELEFIMRKDGFWHAKPPSLEALSSSLPFAVDTMEITDWLQFIFLPRMHALLAEQAQLPIACAIAPAAEVALMGRDGVENVLVQLRAIDKLLAG
jgi:uncharacterized protein YqcC (DUF446 family)